MTEAKPHIFSSVLHGQSSKTYTDTHVSLSFLDPSHSSSLWRPRSSMELMSACFRQIEFVRDIDVCMGVCFFVGQALQSKSLPTFLISSNAMQIVLRLLICFQMHRFLFNRPTLVWVFSLCNNVPSIVARSRT